MLLIGMDVVGRYALNRTWEGVLEVSEICLVAIAFIGAAWLLRKEGHVKIDILVNRLSVRGQAFMDFFTSIILLGSSFIVAWYGLRITINYYQRGIHTSTVLAYPMYIHYIIIFVGACLLTIQGIRRIYRYYNIIKGKSSLEENIHLEYE